MLRRLAFLAALGLVLLSSSCSFSDDTVDTTRLRERIDSLIAATEFDEEFGDGVLEACPFDPTVLTTLFDDVVDPSLLTFAEGDDDLFASALRLPISGATLLGCSHQPNDTGIGLDISPAPASIEAFLREFNDPDGESTLTWQIEEIREHGGGEVFHVFVSDSEDPEFGGSEVYWIDENVMITAFGFGPAAGELDLDTVEERLLAELGTLADEAASQSSS